MEVSFLLRALKKENQENSTKHRMPNSNQKKHTIDWLGTSEASGIDTVYYRLDRITKNASELMRELTTTPFVLFFRQASW